MRRGISPTQWVKSPSTRVLLPDPIWDHLHRPAEMIQARTDTAARLVSTGRRLTELEMDSGVSLTFAARSLAGLTHQDDSGPVKSARRGIRRTAILAPIGLPVFTAGRFLGFPDRQDAGAVRDTVSAKHRPWRGIG